MNISRLLMVILLVVTAVIIAELAENPAGNDGAEQKAEIWGDGSLDAFVSESQSYEDHFVFTYIPRNPETSIDCYVTYEFKEDGNTLESADKKLYENVSAENPIVLEFPRQQGSTYELEVTIKDKSGINLHKSGIEIYPQTEGNESEQ